VRRAPPRPPRPRPRAACAPALQRVRRLRECRRLLGERLRRFALAPLPVLERSQARLQVLALLGRRLRFQVQESAGERDGHGVRERASSRGGPCAFSAPARAEGCARPAAPPGRQLPLAVEGGKLAGPDVVEPAADHHPVVGWLHRRSFSVSTSTAVADRPSPARRKRAMRQPCITTLPALDRDQRGTAHDQAVDPGGVFALGDGQLLHAPRATSIPTTRLPVET
jgi:hypothetical protein